MNFRSSTRNLFYILIVINLVLSACTPQAVNKQATPTLSPPKGQAVTSTTRPTDIKLTSTPSKPTSTAVPKSTPQQTSTPKAGLGISFDYQAVQFGKPVEIVDRGRTLSVQVNKVTLGKDADVIALGKAPDEMQWVIIQLVIKYLKGDSQKREQLLDPEMFDIVSNGHLSTGLPFLTYTPSPHIDDVILLPGESSLGYLAYQTYRDDPAPLLRLKVEETNYFFQLSKSTVEKIVPEQGYRLSLDMGTGTIDQPIPIGTAAYVVHDDSVYKITVQKTLRGFNAWKKIHDVWGINKEPPLGQEYVMPFVSVQVISAANPITRFLDSSLSSYSNQKKDSQPYNFFCPLPCFNSADLYPNGTVSGWVPLIAYKDDPSPLLAFDNRLYFKLVVETGSPSTSQPKISPKAIGYDRREKIHPFLELKQTGPVNVIAFTPDDKYVLTGGDDKKIHVWEIETGSETTTLIGHIGSVKNMAFSADGKWMASTAASPEILVWDTSNWQLLQKLTSKGMGIGVKFLADGTLLSINTAGYITYWDVEAGKTTLSGVVPRNMSPTCSGSPLFSFDSSEDGSILAASMNCGYAVIWKQESGEIVFADFNRQNDMRSKRKPISSVITLSRDGKEAAFGMVYYPDWRLMLLDVIDVQNKKVVASVSPMNPDLFSARIAPNNDLILAGVGNTVTVWWPEAYVWGSDNLTQLTGHSGLVTTLRFSNSGEILASGDYTGKTVLWTAE